MSKLARITKFAALPTIGVGALSYGIGGKGWPAMSNILEQVQQWLVANTDYPVLVVFGATTLLLWTIYQIASWYFVGRKKRWRTELINLLNEGVVIRNDGRLTIQTTQQAADWMVLAKKWDEDVESKIRELDEAEAEDFALLDVSPPPRLCIKTLMKDHSFDYQHHDYRLVKLRDLIHRTRSVD